MKHKAISFVTLGLERFPSFFLGSSIFAASLFTTRGFDSLRNKKAKITATPEKAPAKKLMINCTMIVYNGNWLLTFSNAAPRAGATTHAAELTPSRVDNHLLRSLFAVTSAITLQLEKRKNYTLDLKSLNQKLNQ